MEETNQLLESVDCGYLTSTEQKNLFTEKQLIIILKQKAENIQSIETLSSYYLRFLKQAHRGDFSYYEEIAQEKEEVKTILEQCVNYKFYIRYLEIWRYASPFFFDRGYWKDFEFYSKKACGIANIIGAWQEQARCLIEELSWLYYWQGEFQQEEKVLFQAEHILEQKADTYLQALCQLRKGLLCKSNSRFAEADKYLTQAHRYFKNIDNPDLLSKSALYLGQLRQAQKQYDNAEKHYKSALKYGKRTDNENEAKALYYLGAIHFQTKRALSARHYFSEALQIDQKNHRIAGFGWNYYGLACAESGETQKNLAFAASECFSNLKMNDQAHMSKLLIKNNTTKSLFELP